MTKLTEWLTVGSIIVAIWIGLLTNFIENKFSKNYPNGLLYFPLVCVVLFGIYAAAIVLYRVFTFNDCKEAADELQKEIVEAKNSLVKLGYKVKEKST